jgi:hypothetical protein
MSEGSTTISFGRWERQAVGVQRSSAVPLRYFFFGFALLLGEDFGLAAGLAFLPDLHPHVLHILAPFQKEHGSTSWRRSIGLWHRAITL